MSAAFKVPRIRRTAPTLVVESAAADRHRLYRYRRYWRSITPVTDRDVFNRWLFALASIQTSWSHNVRIYRALVAPGVSFDEGDLFQLFRHCGAGLERNRSRGVAKLHADFWADPSRFKKQAGETFIECRDRLIPLIHGLGIAKVAFGLELLYPLEAETVCLDRHMLRLFGVDAERGSDRLYRKAEAHWIEACRKYKVPSPLARHLYWDDLQGYRSTRYWAKVFEPSECVAA